MALAPVWLATTLLLISLCNGQDIQQGDAMVLREDGAACWFQDPRAITDPAGDKTFVGWISSTAEWGVSTYDHLTGAVSSTTIGGTGMPNDHDNPALLRMQDGRLAVFFAAHNSPHVSVAVSVRPDDASEFGSVQAIDATAQGTQPWGVTYPNPMLLPGGRVALFFRGINWQPTVLFGDPGLSTWTAPVQAFQSSGARGYAKYVASQGTGRVHIAVTDGHPRDEPQNKVYHAYLEGDAWHRMDGSRIKGLHEGPLTPAEAELVYDASLGRAWVWDVALTPDGRPVIAFTAMPRDDAHGYFYGEWGGSSSSGGASDEAADAGAGTAAGASGGVDGGWRWHQMVSGQRWLPQTPKGAVEPEPHYSGGLGLDHADPRVVYVAHDVQGTFEIERWETRDGGRLWATRAITSNSDHSNVRPFVARRASLADGGSYGSARHVVIWVHLEKYYVHYLKFNTSLMLLSAAEAA